MPIIAPEIVEEDWDTKLGFFIERTFLMSTSPVGGGGVIRNCRPTHPRIICEVLMTQETLFGVNEVFSVLILLHVHTGGIEDKLGGLRLHLKEVLHETRDTVLPRIQN